jgi:hypothetical protein
MKDMKHVRGTVCLAEFGHPVFEAPISGHPNFTHRTFRHFLPTLEFCHFSLQHHQFLARLETDDLDCFVRLQIAFGRIFRGSTMFSGSVISAGEFVQGGVGLRISISEKWQK